MQSMKYVRHSAFALLVGATVLATTACSVVREQQSVGSYVDDAGITTAIKARFAEDRTVAATTVSVETMKGHVQLSGFAKSQTEKDRAEYLARGTKGVISVKNSIEVRP